MRKSSRSRSKASRPHRVGTIAAYGPDNTLATKLVASVLDDSGRHEPVAMRTWTTLAADVRHDPTISAAVADFLREYAVTKTAASDRMLGCPHEEGIDYPMGRTCPRCPYWAAIDRFTHEPIVVPEPTMSPSEILAALADAGSTHPQDALTSADGHREALVAPLLAAIEHGIAHPAEATPQESNLFSYALYLLAKWRDARALPHVVRWLSLPEEQPFDIGGDIVTQDGARILAAVCDGDLAPIKALILNRDADEYGRGAGIGALALLAAWAEMPRAPIVEYFLWLAREGLEREPGVAWDSLASNAADIEALEVFPELRRAYDEELVDEQYMTSEELDDAESAPSGRMLEALRTRQPPIDDVVEAISWWSAFSDDNEEWDDEEDIEAIEPQEPYRAPPKVGRNEPCTCGSGKKYKKCCGS